MLRIVGVDIGIRNLSMCRLEVVAATGAVTKAPPLDKAVAALETCSLLHWTVSDLCGAQVRNVNRCSHGAILDGLVAFVREHSDVIQWATHFVIEAQPNARMKMVAGALYALVKSQRGDECAVVMQPARRKLSAWGAAALRLYAPEVKQTTYADRKKGAVALTARLLEDSHRAQDLAALRSTRKKDDMADSFLHALSFAVTAC